jgi:hypothetical protein
MSYYFFVFTKKSSILNLDLDLFRSQAFLTSQIPDLLPDIWISDQLLNILQDPGFIETNTSIWILVLYLDTRSLPKS